LQASDLQLLTITDLLRLTLGMAQGVINVTTVGTRGSTLRQPGLAHPVKTVLHVLGVFVDGKTLVMFNCETGVDPQHFGGLGRPSSCQFAGIIRRIMPAHDRSDKSTPRNGPGGAGTSMAPLRAARGAAQRRPMATKSVASADRFLSGKRMSPAHPPAPATDQRVRHNRQRCSRCL
jgi:hypothetical protein